MSEEIKDKEETLTPEEERDQLKSLLQGVNHEREDTFKGKFSLGNIIGGDFLMSKSFRHQIPLVGMITLYAILYVDNRYEVQQQLIEINRLETLLQDTRYNALTRSSELTEMSRQSKIEEFIQSSITDLQTATQPPFLIKKQDDDRAE